MARSALWCAGEATTMEEEACALLLHQSSICQQMQTQAAFQAGTRVRADDGDQVYVVQQSYQLFDARSGVLVFAIKEGDKAARLVLLNGVHNSVAFLCARSTVLFSWDSPLRVGSTGGGTLRVCEEAHAAWAAASSAKAGSSFSPSLGMVEDEQQAVGHPDGPDGTDDDHHKSESEAEAEAEAESESDGASFPVSDASADDDDYADGASSLQRRRAARVATHTSSSLNEWITKVTCSLQGVWSSF